MYASNLFKLAHGLILLVKGTPVVLYGDEIELQGRNELENTMQFENSVGCGFTESQEVAGFFEKSTSNCQNAALTDLRKMYQDLAKLREETAFSTGDIVMLENSKVLAFVRKAEDAGGDKYLVLVNTEDQAVDLDLSGELARIGMLETHGSVVYYYSVYSSQRKLDSMAEVNSVQVRQGEILVLKLGGKKESEDEFD